MSNELFILPACIFPNFSSQLRVYRVSKDGVHSNYMHICISVYVRERKRERVCDHINVSTRKCTFWHSWRKKKNMYFGASIRLQNDILLYVIRFEFHAMQNAEYFLWIISNSSCEMTRDHVPIHTHQHKYIRIEILTAVFFSKTSANQILCFFCWRFALLCSAIFLQSTLRRLQSM